MTDIRQNNKAVTNRVSRIRIDVLNLFLALNHLHFHIKILPYIFLIVLSLLQWRHMYPILLPYSSPRSSWLVIVIYMSISWKSLPTKLALSKLWRSFTMVTHSQKECLYRAQSTLPRVISLVLQGPSGSYEDLCVFLMRDSNIPSHKFSIELVTAPSCFHQPAQAPFQLQISRQ